MKQLLIVILFINAFFYSQTIKGQQQDRVDFNVCYNGACSGKICILPTDTVLNITVDKIVFPSPPSGCTFSTYKIYWDYTNNRNIFNEYKSTDLTPKSYPYNLKDFINNCTKSSEVFFIYVVPNCDNTDKAIPLTVNKKPVANFNLAGDACEGELTRFINNSCPRDNSVSYKWDFDDGSPTSTEKDPSHKFTFQKEPYKVTLTTSTSECGNSTPVERDVKVLKKPVAKFAPTSGFIVSNKDTIICLSSGGTLTLDGTLSIDQKSYEWSIQSPAGGSFSYINNTNKNSDKITVKFNTSGNYIINLTVRNDCGVASATPCVHKVVQNPTITLPKLNPICDKDEYLYTIPNPVKDVTYKIDGVDFDPVAGTKLVRRNTPYKIEAILNSACPAPTVTEFVSVTNPQKVKINTSPKNRTLCAGESVFVLDAEPASGNWQGQSIETQNGKKVFNPKNAGTYQLIYGGDCLIPDTLNVTVIGVSATATDVAVCKGVTFALLNGKPSLGKYNVKNCTECSIKGDTLFLNNTSKEKIDIDYVVTSQNNCQANASFSVNIGNPKADFDTTGRACTGKIKIVNLSSGASTYKWFVDDKSQSTEKNPELPIPFGTFTVKLEVSSGDCKDIKIKNFTNTPPPSGLEFDVDKRQICSGESVKITPKSPKESSLTYSWVFGDGTPNSSDFLPEPHKFTNSTKTVQKYTIRFTAYHSCTTLIAIPIEIEVKPGAKVEIGADSTTTRCSPAIVKFSNISTDKNGTWDFGGGTPLYVPANNKFGDTLSVKFVNNDTTTINYTVKYTINSSCGGVVSDAIPIAVKPKNIIARFEQSLSEICPGETVQFFDKSTPKPDRVFWDFGDGKVDYTANPKHPFPNKPNTEYTVKLTATNATCNSSDTISHKVKVNKLPEGDFELPPISCNGQEIQILNKTDLAGSNIYGFQWNFGDNSSLDSSTHSPKHIFKKTGINTVTLTLYGLRKTCKNEIKHTINVNNIQKPIADFDFADSVICVNNTVSLINKSKNYDEFEFYNGNNKLDTTKKFDEIDSYNITLFAYNTGKVCRDSITKVLKVDSCKIYVPNAFTPNGDGENDEWVITNIENFPNAKVIIFNRWGSEVYKSLEKYHEHPFGRDENEKKFPVGIYVYIIDLRPKAELQKGWVMLLK